MKKSIVIIIFILGLLVIPKTTVFSYFWTDAPTSTTTGGYEDIKIRNPEPCEGSQQCADFKKVVDLHNAAVYSYNALIGEYNRLEDEIDKGPQLDAMDPLIEKAFFFLDQSDDNVTKYVDSYKSKGATHPETVQFIGWIQSDHAELKKQANEALKILNKDLDDAVDAGILKAAECWPDLKPILHNCVNEAIKTISVKILQVSAWFLGVTGLVLDTVINKTVVGMKSMFDKIDAISSGWRLIRDIGNSFFIFILLYVAITTVLGINDGNAKRIIRNIIIVGLLVNFSLFFTKVLIDASNVTTIFFYNAIVEKPVDDTAGAKIESFSGKFASTLGITSLYNPDDKIFANAAGGDGTKMLIIGIGGSMFLLVTAFAFLVAALLLTIRFVVLIVLLMISPLAYFGFILPGTEQYAKKWWNMLTSQLMFAPVFMIMMFLVLTLAQTFSAVGMGGNKSLLGAFAITPETAKNIAATAAATSGNTAASHPLESIFNFVVIIGLVILSIIISTSIASGTGGFVGNVVKRSRNAFVGGGKWVGRRTAGAGASTAAFAGRNTVGRIATNQLNNNKEALQRTALTGNLVSRNIASATLKGLQKTSDRTFDARNTDVGKKLGLGVGAKSFSGNIDEKAEREVKMVKEYGGASAETNEKIGIASTEMEKQKKAFANAKTPEEKARAGYLMRKAQGDLDKHQKEAKKERTQQQADYIYKRAHGTDLKTRVATHIQFKRSAYRKAAEKFSAAPTDEKEKAKLRIEDLKEDIKGAIETAKADTEGGSYDEKVAKLLKDVLKRPEDVAKLDVKTLIGEDGSPRPEVVRMLDNKILDAIKKRKESPLNDTDVAKVSKAILDQGEKAKGYSTIANAKKAEDYWHIGHEAQKAKEPSASKPKGKPSNESPYKSDGVKYDPFKVNEVK